MLLGILINAIQMRDMSRRFDSLENRMDAWFNRLGARFNELDNRIDGHSTN